MTQLFLGVNREQSSTIVLRRDGPCNHADGAKFRDAIRKHALVRQRIPTELLLSDDQPRGRTK